MRQELLASLGDVSILARIPKRKLGRYKSLRKKGLTRKEACKALDLSYSIMKKADILLGFYKPRKFDHLKKYQYKKGENWITKAKERNIYFPIGPLTKEDTEAANLFGGV